MTIHFLVDRGKNLTGFLVSWMSVSRALSKLSALAFASDVCSRGFVPFDVQARSKGQEGRQGSFEEASPLTWLACAYGSLQSVSKNLLAHTTQNLASPHLSISIYRCF